MEREHLGVPGNFFARMAHEVDEVELPPEAAAGFVGDAPVEKFNRFPAPPFGNVGERGFAARADKAFERGMVEVFKERRLPGRPYLGRGRTDVGDGEKVERIEPLLGSHEADEALNHFRV